MKQSFVLKSIRYSTKQLGEGSVTIDENTNEVEIFERRRRWLKENLEIVRSFKFDAQTKAKFDGTRIFVDDLELVTMDENTSKSITEILGRPRNEARRRAIREALERMEKSARDFLAQRAETLSWAQNLKTDPRRTLIQASSELSQDTQDPVAELLQSRSAELKKGLETVDTTVAGINDEIRGSWIDAYFAAIYGIGIIQNGIFNNDSSSSDAGFRLLSEILSKDFNNARGLSLEETTKRLSDQTFTQIAQTTLSTP